MFRVEEYEVELRMKAVLIEKRDVRVEKLATQLSHFLNRVPAFAGTTFSDRPR